MATSFRLCSARGNPRVRKRPFAREGVTLKASRSASPALGFTLVELVTVIVILGILAAVVLPRLGGVSVYGERASGDRLVSGLRYAQQQALSRNRFVRVRTVGGERFEIRFCDLADATIPDDCAPRDWKTLSPPSTEETSWELAGGVTFDGSVTLYFDALGRSIGSAGTVTEEVVFLGGRAVKVTVEGETGYAHST